MLSESRMFLDDSKKTLSNTHKIQKNYRSNMVTIVFSILNLIRKILYWYNRSNSNLR